MARKGWNDFIVWLCSLRQRNFRMFNGKPSEGVIALIRPILEDRSILKVGHNIKFDALIMKQNQKVI